MKTKFVSFYSDRENNHLGSSYYKECMDRLTNRLKELEAEYYTEELPSTNNYMLNCLMKPEFILNTLKKLDEPIIWIDADCTINELPTEFEGVECDIALCLREHDGVTPHSALLYFNNTPKSREFIEEWMSKCKSKEEAARKGEYTLGDHEQLILTYQENKCNANIISFAREKNICTANDSNPKVSIGISWGQKDDKMKTKFISFYSDRSNNYFGPTYYKGFAFNLSKKLQELEIPYHIEELPSRENYRLNCLMKPEFILNTLINLDEPLIWIDVDSTIEEIPTRLFDLDSLDCDIAVFLRDQVIEKIKFDEVTPYCGLMYFNNTPGSIAFLREWDSKCKEVEAAACVGKYKLGDHHKFIETWRENKCNANIISFPPSENIMTATNPTTMVSLNEEAKIKSIISSGESDEEHVPQNRLQALYPPFRLEDGSSCGKRNPAKFKWVSDEYPLQVFIDNGMNMVPSHPKRAGSRFYGWLCESRAIVPELYSLLKDNYKRYFDYFDVIFTCDETLLSLDDRFKFAFSGSNTPWTPLDEYGIHQKTKNCSLLASPKKSTGGHALRHELAEKYAGQVDLFGGVLGSLKIGTSDFASSAHPPKTGALKDYRFSITIENDSYNNYFTEKITDCFANGTVPVYWGCPNIGKYFNTDGIIFLTPTFKIEDLTEDLYNNKMDAIKDNYERVKNIGMADDILWKAISDEIDEVSSCQG